jgi:hypothetical protein
MPQHPDPFGQFIRNELDFAGLPDLPPTTPAPLDEQQVDAALEDRLELGRLMRERIAQEAQIAMDIWNGAPMLEDGWRDRFDDVQKMILDAIGRQIDDFLRAKYHGRGAPIALDEIVRDVTRITWSMIDSILDGLSSDQEFVEDYLFGEGGSPLDEAEADDEDDLDASF